MTPPSVALSDGTLFALGPWTVGAVVLVFLFVECAFVVGLFLPGDSLLVGAGVVLAQHDHELGTWVLAGLGLVVAAAGNQVGYRVGRYTGTRVLARREGRLLNRANLARATAFLDRWGFWAILVARWLPWVRTLAPMIAGAARMDNRRFLIANTVGALLWVPTLLLVGYYGAGLLDLLPWLGPAATVAAVLALVAGTGYGVVRYRQDVRKPVDLDAPSVGPAAERAPGTT